MQSSARAVRGFTLIELLTVIAIIAVLAALLFPVMSTAREQARATSCMSNMHALWVAANVYKQDEGAYPAVLLGTAEIGDTGSGACNPSVSTGQPNLGGNACFANADAIIHGFLYSEQTKDANNFHCPDNPTTNKALAVTAYYPLKPPAWPTNRPYVTDAANSTNFPNAPSNVCPSDSGGLYVCFTDGPNRGQKKIFYQWDNGDVGPRINPDGTVAMVNGNVAYDLHYSTDWTGVTGTGDLPIQLKYSNPPSDKTILTYCTWHTAAAHVNTFPAISMAGTARKIDLKTFLAYGADYFNR